MATIEETAEFTTLQTQLGDIARGVQAEKEALEAAIARVDKAYADLLQLQTDFFPISQQVEALLASDPTNQSYINMDAQKDQQILDFTALRDVASDMATSMDPYRAA